MLYIGIDLGTSAVKLLLMNSEGRIEKIVSREYPLYFPQSGWSEQEPEDWFRETMAGIRELTAECDKNQVAGISFGGQMHGLVALEADDNVIRPAILWNDGRTGRETDYLNEVIGREKIAEYTAEFATPYVAAAHGYVDAVIEPSETREYILDALNLFENKKREGRIRGNMPL